jgi:hypothetical protein
MGTGMKTLFYEIIQERKKELNGWEYCECVDCKKKIGIDALTPWNFSHDRGKNVAPQDKFNKKNISIRCVTCHMMRDHGLKNKMQFSN